MIEPIKFEPLLKKNTKLPKAFALAILYLRISPNKNITQKCICKKVPNTCDCIYGPPG